MQREFKNPRQERLFFAKIIMFNNFFAWFLKAFLINIHEQIL